ncbi:unnamed protein product [Closterium sp. Naga37s-1]|nr:unnamed protein product [Closterium sp. Naga37s-1]
MEGYENFEEVSFRSPGGLVFEPLSEDEEEEEGGSRGGSEREDTGEEVVVCEDIREWEGMQERGRGGVREIEREDEVSVDGGGVRDAILTQICVRLEAMLQEGCGDPNVRLADFFDLFAGEPPCCLFPAARVYTSRAHSASQGNGAACHQGSHQGSEYRELGVQFPSLPPPSVTPGTSGGGLLALMLTAPHRETGRPAIRAQDVDGGRPGETSAFFRREHYGSSLLLHFTAPIFAALHPLSPRFSLIWRS